jgi:hypothetical protein
MYRSWHQLKVGRSNSELKGRKAVDAAKSRGLVVSAIYLRDTRPPFFPLKTQMADSGHGDLFQIGPITSFPFEIKAAQGRWR